MNPATCALCPFTTPPDSPADPDQELSNHIRYTHASNIAHWYPLAAAAAALGLNNPPGQGPITHNLEDQKLHDISDLVDDWALDAKTQPPAIRIRITRRVTAIRAILGRARLR